MKYDRPIHPTFPHEPTCAGREVKETYMLEYLPNGEAKLVKSGTVNIQDEINSHVELCDVKNIIKRFTAAGEEDKLMARGVVADFTQMPKNLAELHLLMHNAEEAYKSLRPDVAKNFASFDDFLATFGSADSLGRFLAEISKPEKPNMKISGGGELNEIEQK